MLIKKFDEYHNSNDFTFNELNEKKVISTYNIQQMITNMGLVEFDSRLNKELTKAIIDAITPILTKRGYEIRKDI